MGHLFRRVSDRKTYPRDRRVVRAMRRSAPSHAVSAAIEQLEERRVLSATHFAPFIGPQMAITIHEPPIERVLSNLPIGSVLPGSGLPGAAENVQQFNGYYEGVAYGNLNVGDISDSFTSQAAVKTEITIKDGHVTLKFTGHSGLGASITITETGTINGNGVLHTSGDATITFVNQHGKEAISHGIVEVVASFHTSPDRPGSIAGDVIARSDEFLFGANFDAFKR